MDGAWGIAVDADAGNVYWTTHTSVMSSAVDRPNSQKTIFSSGVTGVLGLAIDGRNVYWTNSITGDVMECGFECPGFPVTLASNQGAPTFIAVDDANVYWTNNSSGSVVECGIGGCPGGPKTLATNQSSPMGIVVDTDSIYWTDFGGNTTVGGPVMRLRK